METVLEDKSLLVFALLYFSTAFYKGGFFLIKISSKYLHGVIRCLFKNVQDIPDDLSVPELKELNSEVNLPKPH
jgi:hypothetical protein